MNNKPPRALLALAAIVLSASPSYAQDADSRDDTSPARAADEPLRAGAESPRPAATPRARSAEPTARVLNKVELNAIPFREALDQLREQTGANLFVSWNVLKRAGVDGDTPVDVNLTNVTLGR